jgi:serine/threonine protein kinase
MAAGQWPFPQPKEQPREFRDAVTNGWYPEDLLERVFPPIQELIDGFLKPNVEDRLTIKQALSSDVFSTIAETKQAAAEMTQGWPPHDEGHGSV